MQALKIAPNGAFFRSKLAKKGCFRPITGDFQGFLFTDEYIVAIGQAVCFVHLALIAAPQKAGFAG
jgi:hypothetical protein